MINPHIFGEQTWNRNTSGSKITMIYHYSSLWLSSTHQQELGFYNSTNLAWDLYLPIAGWLWLITIWPTSEIDARSVLSRIVEALHWVHVFGCINGTPGKQVLRWKAMIRSQGGAGACRLWLFSSIHWSLLRVTWQMWWLRAVNN